MRIGAVNYLNSKPLVYGLEPPASDEGELQSQRQRGQVHVRHVRFAVANFRAAVNDDVGADSPKNGPDPDFAVPLATGHRLLFDLPSRLADSLATGRLDVALIPSVEFFRTPGYHIVSDACVACRGPVRSVKLHFRVPPQAVTRIALDEGSRTSAALALILLRELAGVTPNRESLPIGCGVDDTDADAVLLIGDRAMQPVDGSFVEAWDLGERWQAWTGLPFVFAMWVARAGVDTTALADILAAARDRGVAALAEIAAREGPPLGITAKSALSYLRDNLHFTLGEQELSGLRRFYQLCVEGGFVPGNLDTTWDQFYAHGCTEL